MRAVWQLSGLAVSVRQGAEGHLRHPKVGLRGGDVAAQRDVLLLQGVHLEQSLLQPRLQNSDPLLLVLYRVRVALLVPSNGTGRSLCR